MDSPTSPCCIVRREGFSDDDRDGGTLKLATQSALQSARAMQCPCDVGPLLHAVVGPTRIPSRIGKPRSVARVGGCRAKIADRGRFAPLSHCSPENRHVRH